MIRLREYWGSKWPKCTTFTPSSTRGVLLLTGSLVNRWPDPLEELMHRHVVREALQRSEPPDRGALLGGDEIVIVEVIELVAQVLHVDASPPEREVGLHLLFERRRGGDLDEVAEVTDGGARARSERGSSWGCAPE